MVWMNTGALSEEKLLEVDKRMEKLLLPSDIGRLARKISKSYKCMKADEWDIGVFNVFTSGDFEYILPQHMVSFCQYLFLNL